MNSNKKLISFLLLMAAAIYSANLFASDPILNCSNSFSTTNNPVATPRSEDVLKDVEDLLFSFRYGDVVDSSKLEIGMKFFLLGEYFHPTKEDEVDQERVYEVTVINKLAHPKDDITFRDNNPYMYQIQSQDGKTAIMKWYEISTYGSKSEMMGHVFAPGDYANWKMPKGKQELQVYNKKSTQVLYGSDDYRTVQIIEIIDRKRIAVRFESKDNEISPLKIIVPSTQLTPTYIHSRAQFEKAIDSIGQIKLQFDLKEKILVRLAGGEITIGEILEMNGEEFFLKLENGKKIYRNNKFIFKFNGHTPIKFSSLLRSRMMPIYSAPEKSVLMLLNGALRVSSLEDYRRKNDKERLKITTNYLRTFISWRAEALHSEDGAINTNGKVVCTGQGVCRHLSVLLRQILMEQGFNTKIAVYFVPGESDGHAWLEVYLNDDIPGTPSYVIDPSSPKASRIHTWDEVLELRDNDPKSMSARFYTAEKRDLF